MTASSVTARTLSTPSAIESIAAEWRALEAATPEATGFQSAAWRLCCAAEGLQPRIVAVRENRRLVMLLPLQVETRTRFSIARWLGEPLAQYGDALALPDARRKAWFAAAEAEISSWSDVDLVALSRLRADGVLASCASPSFAETAKCAAPYVDLSAPALKRRQSLDRRSKKLAQFGPLRFEAAQGAEARREAAAQALEFKRQWLRRRRRFSTALSQDGVGECLLDLAERGVLRAHRLWAGERLVSVELGIKAGAYYRSLIGAYDDALSAASPDHVLTLRLIESLAEEGVERLDFLPSTDPCKMEFVSGAVLMGALYLPLNRRGVLAASALERLRPPAKRAAVGLSDAGGSLERLLRRSGANRPDRAASARSPGGPRKRRGAEML